MDARGHNVTRLRAVQPRVDLTLDEVADTLHCSYRTVLRLLASGAFPSIKVGRHRMVAAADVDAYVQSLRTT
jgi:excisionase family DNA binding protein